MVSGGTRWAARGATSPVAWPAAEAEPAEWPIDRVDPIPNKQGSPGIFADAQFGVYFDNLKVTPNQ